MRKGKKNELSLGITAYADIYIRQKKIVLENILGTIQIVGEALREH